VDICIYIYCRIRGVWRVRFLSQLVGRTGGTLQCVWPGEDTAKVLPPLYTFRVRHAGEESSQSWQKTTVSFEFIRTRGFSDQLKLQPNYYYIPFKADARVYVQCTSLYVHILYIIYIYIQPSSKRRKLATAGGRGSMYDVVGAGSFGNDLSAQTPRILWIRPETRLDRRNIRSDELSIRALCYHGLRIL